jgi:hypothetical protein
MSETKDEIAAERDQLRAENENLRGQLVAAGAGRPGTAAPAQHRFFLTEGERQELELNGNAVVGGKLMTTEQVRAKLSGDFADVEIADATNVREVPSAHDRPKVAGIDYIYPSVAYGELDPAVAGTPGFNGPAAPVEPTATPVDQEWS